MGQSVIADRAPPTASEKPTEQSVSRRNILLGGTSFAAASRQRGVH
jgi:hypothetical protein